MILPALKKIYYRYIKNLDVLESNKMASIGDTCGIVINYKTPDLIRKFLSDFRHYYPDLHLLILDNSNFDRSTNLLFSFCKKDGNMTLLANKFNVAILIKAGIILLISISAINIPLISNLGVIANIVIFMCIYSILTVKYNSQELIPYLKQLYR